jgi:dTDP-4-amino-4,6-dideoxygalactose transaminase
MIKFLDLQKINMKYQAEIERNLINVFRSGWYIGGEEVNNFENKIKKYIGCNHFIGVANGLDALRIIIRAYIELGVFKEGDEIIVPANTYIATILSITENRLIPKLIEPDVLSNNIDFKKIEENITTKTKAILVVHLYGAICWDNELERLAKNYNLKIIEDNAQAIGAIYKNKKSGTLGDAAGFSFYPGKNLGAIGDAGGISCKDKLLAQKIRIIANYGSKDKYINILKGVNSRLDSIQAIVLNIKLDDIDDANEKRRQIAKYFIDNIKNDKIELPLYPEKSEQHVWHLFVIKSKNRDKLKEFLFLNEIETLIHYPIPPHLQQAYIDLKIKKGDLPITEKLSKSCLSIPISPVLEEFEKNKIVEILNSY